jgi:hypothetical protein
MRSLQNANKCLILLVRTAGLEPAQGFPQGILSPLRLPFRHVREGGHPYHVREASDYNSSAKRTAKTRSPERSNNYCCFFFAAEADGAGRTSAQGSARF